MTLTALTLQGEGTMQDTAWIAQAKAEEEE